MSRINVKVRPDSDRFKVENGYMPKFYLEAEAEKGRANKELINKVEQIMDEKPAIVSGHRSRRKKLKLSMTEQEFKQKLEDYNG